MPQVSPMSWMMMSAILLMLSIINIKYNFKINSIKNMKNKTNNIFISSW